MANLQMDYQDFPLKQCGFSLKLRADSASVIGPMSALGVKTGNPSAGAACPFYSTEQTSRGRLLRSASCHNRTSHGAFFESPGNIDTAVIDGWRRPQRAGSAVSPRQGARREKANFT